MSSPLLHFDESPKIRDSYKVRWDRRVHPDDTGEENPREQRRWIQSLTYHVECRTSSTYSDEFLAFCQESSFDDPAVMVPGYVPGMASQELSFIGEWQVDEVSVSDEPGAKAVVQVSLTKSGDWEDIV